ncbi:MAG: hypothetical protein ACE5IW_11610, partial [bacterium]
RLCRLGGPHGKRGRVALQGCRRLKPGLPIERFLEAVTIPTGACGGCLRFRKRMPSISSEGDLLV